MWRLIAILDMHMFFFSQREKLQIFMNFHIGSNCSLNAEMSYANYSIDAT
jgi:hypothetical protein